MSKLKSKKKRHKEKVSDDEKIDDIIDDKMDGDIDMSEFNTKDTDKELKMNKVMQRGIASAKKHKIELESGKENSGQGNCSYESVIFNINERKCFHTKLPLSPDIYRRIWNVDLMNKILDKKIPWNPGMTRQEIQDGFQEIMESGVYERQFFGDMMMAGIACGIRKRILIFNTNENITTTGHDPISVVDPRDYGGDVDSDIPVVLAYNLVHFESLHPVDEVDIQETINLTNSYSRGDYDNAYGFTRCDMPYLISLSTDNSIQKNLSKENEPDQSRGPPPKKSKYSEMAQNKVPDATKKNPKNLEENEDFVFDNIRFKGTENGKIRCGICELECARLVVHLNGNEYCTEYLTDMAEFKRKYSEFRDKMSKRKNDRKRYSESQEGYKEMSGKRKHPRNEDHYGNTPQITNKSPLGTENEESETAQKNKMDGLFKFGGFDFLEIGNEKMRCGICQVECIRLVVHMNGSQDCAKHFHMPDFKIEYSRYRHRQRVKKHEEKQKAENPKGFKDSYNKRVKKHEEKQKAENPKGFKDSSNKRVKKYQEKQKAENPKGFKDNYNKSVKKHEEKQKAENPKGFQDNLNKRVKKHEEKQKAENPKGFQDNHNKRVKKHEEKQKAENPKGFQDNLNKRVKKHEEKQKAENPKGFQDNHNKRVKKHEEKQKAENPKGFQDNLNKRVKKHEEKQKAENPKGFQDNHNKRVKKHEEKQKAENPKGFQDNHNKRVKKHEEKQKAKDLESFKEHVRQRKEKSSMNVSACKRLQNFRRRVQFGPIFVCSCCHQKLFENQVEEISDSINEQIDKVDPGIREECIDEEIQVDLGRNGAGIEIKSSYLCKSCKWYLIRGRMPKLCTKNGLSVDRIEDEDLKLTELENNLIARNIIFQKIHKLPKSRWSGTHDRLINVPVRSDDVLNTVNSLPRTPAEAGIIPIVPVNLKRKLEYKTTHLTQLIDTNKIFKYLKYLRDMGHPGYKFYDDYNLYEKRCLSEDPNGAKLLFPEAEAEIVELDVYLSELKELNSGKIDQAKEDDDELERDQKEEEEYVKKDPIRKFQYDYMKSTCMTNKFPEADSSSALDFAPAEGKIPTNILKDKNWDINSFPNLHPSGQNSMFSDRDIKLTPQQYLGQRLKNKDTRFEQCTPYVFAAAGYVEEKQMERNIGLSYNKGKKIESIDGSKTYELDDAFSVLDNVKSTPKYWKKAKGEMLGKIDNFGPFHWFYTLSCADMRWDVNFTSILREKGYKIIWDQDQNDEVIVKVEYKMAGTITKVILKKFLDEVCDESLHEFIRTNVFIATRNFIQRVRSFRTEIMMGKNNPMRIRYWSDKMEFQGRGAGHIHGVAWCDLENIFELIKEERKVGVILSNNENSEEEDSTENEEEDSTKDVNHLENAYRSLRENVPLNEKEENVLIDFVDRSVTCTLNPEQAAKMIDVNKTKQNGMKIIKIVKEVQVHYHTKSCKKNGCTVNCRFRFPKFPMWKTILTKSHVDEDDPDARTERQERHQISLRKVMDVLEETEVIDHIMNQYNKENESIKEYRINRKERILKILELADVDPDEYVIALKESSRKGINIILARDIDELYVNNYVPEYIEAWDGNIDWSPVFDFFAVVTYVTEYFTKDESGTSSFLTEASKQIKNLPVKDQKRCIKNVFLTHRQMGLSEAFMKIFPEIRLKDSNISSVFVPLGKREDISRYLMRADPDQEYGAIELFEITGREGLYYEKPNWVEKYLRRDRSEWNEMCFPQYAKMFDPIHKKEQENPTEENEEDFEGDVELEVSDKKESSDFEKDKIIYGQEVKFHYLITETGDIGKRLPKLMKIGNPCPGEPNFLRKRKHPKSLRFYKVKKDLNPARFFLHELMMYRHFGQEDYDRWQDDDMCIKDYEKHKENIKSVKSKVMEWMEDVEEARYFVEEVMKNEVVTDEIGENMDPQKHQDDIECDLDGLEEDEQYRHLDHTGLKDRDFPDAGNWYRKIELKDQNILEQETCRLDKWQRQVVDTGLKFVRGLRKYSKGYSNSPRPENLVVIGGAGSGKSTVIECLAQWCHRLLEKAGDDPNSPYILKAATTGAASSLIEGSTVHTSLGFDFSSKHSSLSDKKREMKIDQLKNLKILIIDEFSMMKSDILYRIHLRLCEIKHSNQYFGGILLMLFGDPAQLKPVLGSYIFAAPNCKDYKIAYGDGTESLWRSFSVINLEENHRQGKDKSYAEMLNRIRVGKQTHDDLESLKSRVRQKGHSDLKGALFISAKVKPVAKFNEIALNKTPGKLYVSKAWHMQALSKSFKPKIEKKSGRIGDTQFVDELNLKIGARVMLITNIDVSDLLCNGTIGTVLGVEEGQNGAISTVIVKFDNPRAGKQSRDRNLMMAKKYPEGTILKKIEREYSLTRNQGLVSSTAKLIQFPLVLAWAVTVHKFQGQTVKAPQKVVIDLRSVFEAAQAYVMGSRVQELDQLYILEELPQEKIYANQSALAEINRLLQVSLNNNPTKWLSKDDQTVKVSFLNSRSVKNKFHNILADTSLLRSDIIILTETWLEEDDDKNMYVIPGYDGNLNRRGRGKGMASYFKEKYFEHELNINHNGFCLSKIASKDLDIIGVYRSQNGNVMDIVTEIKDLLNREKTTVVGGDLNLCVLKQPKNYFTTSLEEEGFHQLVTAATHIEGGAIDHIYISHGNNKKLKWDLEYFPKYYSDHDGLGLTIWTSSEQE